jgi:transducin (beta)-like 1
LRRARAARLRAGKLKATLERHTGPVFALRWNKRGDLLLTSSADESTVVWDVANSSVKQQFSFHGGAAPGDGVGFGWAG